MEGLQRGDPASVGGYQLLGRLGAGGMGQVFLGVSPSGRRVAVKLIHPVHAGTEHFRERFAREIEAARRVGGFHTAPVVDADPHAETPWMVTAYIDGPSLQQAVGRYGPLPPGQVRALGAGLAEGLAAIHAHGLVHRDLKPGNVIMAEDGPRIIDFGVARAIGATTLTSAGSMVGTFAYMSPEQVRADPVMPASDVFSLGSVLAFAAVGRPPFGSDTAATVMFRILGQPPDLAGLADEGLRAVIEACLAKPPADRPPVRDVLAALTGRAPLPAAAAPPAAPAAHGRDTSDQAHASPAIPAETNPGRHALPASHTVPSGALPPDTRPLRTPPPGQSVRARPARRRRPGRRVPLIAAGAVIAVLAAVVPVLLTTSHPGPGASPGDTTAARNLTLHAPSGTPITGLAYSPDGRFLAAVSSSSRSAYVWDLATGKLTVLTEPGPYGITDVAISPDGQVLAAADADNHVYLWKLATDQPTATLANPKAGGFPFGVAFSPDGKLLASGESGGQTYVWDVATGRPVKVLDGTSPIGGVAFSPDGKLLAAAGRGALLWDVATGRRYATLHDPDGDGINDVAFSPDGKVLAASDDSNPDIYLWDVASGTLIGTLTAPQTENGLQVQDGITFSPDGTLLAAADGNGHAYLWDVVLDKLAATFTDPGGANVTDTAFSPDGKVLAIASSKGNVYIRITSQLFS